MVKFSDYYNSYERASPSWRKRVRKNPNVAPGFSKNSLDLKDDQGDPYYYPVTEEKYPVLYKVLKQECDFRKVPMPACYVDFTFSTKLGAAYSKSHTILIDPLVLSLLDEKELHALVAHELKHLYQKSGKNKSEYHAQEYDSDRAAVESTDLRTVKSFIRKGIQHLISERLGPYETVSSFINAMIDTFPFIADFVARNFFIESEHHPSPGKRIRAMEEYSSQLVGSNHSGPGSKTTQR